MNIESRHGVKNRISEQQNFKNPPHPFRKGGVSGGFATLSLFYKKKIEYLPSTFDIRYSLFDIRFLKFLF